MIWFFEIFVVVHYDNQVLGSSAKLFFPMTFELFAYMLLMNLWML